MVRKALLVLLAVVAAVALALGLYARSVLGSDRVRVALEQQLTSALGRPTTIGSAGASIFPRIALTLSDVRVGAAPDVHLDRAVVSTGLRGLFSRRVEEAEVSISGGRMTLGAAGAAAAGAGRATRTAAPGPAVPASADATARPAFTVASVRAITVDDLQLLHDQTTMEVALRSSFDGQTLHVDRLTARTPHSSLDVSGRFDTAGRQGAFEVTGDRADLDELLGLGAALAATASELAGRADGTSTSGRTARLTAKVSVASATFDDYEVSSLRTDVAFDGSAIQLDPLSLDAFGGDFAGRMTMKTAGAQPAIQLRGQAKGLDVARFAESGGREGSISGRLSAAVALTASGADAATVRRSARGTLDVDITDGAIPGLDMVRTVVLAFGKPSGVPPEGSGSTFTRLGGDFVLAGSVLRSDNVAFASRDFDMHGRATLAGDTGAVDAAMTVLLSKELTAQAGTDLRRYTIQDGRIVVPARITGTLAEPSISLDLAAAAQRALENELKRRAKDLLNDLFRRRKGGG